MGWKDIARLASGWAEAKKDELLTADRRQREQAQWRAEEIEEQAQQEAGTSLLEAVLPPRLAQKVTDARPENVAARRAEAEAAEERQRVERLTGMAAAGQTAELTLTVTGGEEGAVTVRLPCERVEEHPGPDEAHPDEPPPLGWLRVQLESVTPVRVGSTTLSALAVAVPDFRGPGRYDLAELARRSEAGEIGWWEALDLYLNPVQEADDRTWYVDVHGNGPVVVEVEESALRFDLPMASAVSSIRASGTIRW